MRKGRQEPAVLIIEDDPVYREVWKRRLRRHIEVFVATSFEDARRIFEQETGRIRLIALCDALRTAPGNGSTVPLLREFRPTFVGTILATSSDPTTQEYLLQAGCDVGESYKANVPTKIMEILGFQQI